MKLFHWPYSEALKRYACGDIIVMAEDVESARRGAMARFEAYLKGSGDAPFHWMFDLYGDIENWDEDDKEKYYDFLKLFEKDLEKEPVKTSGFLFVQGSE